MRKIGIAVLLGAVSACGGGDSLPTGPSPVMAEIEFRTVAAAAPGPSSSTAPPCGDQVHLHPSWWGYAQIDMAPIGEHEWALYFGEVPIGRHTLRIRALEACGVPAVSANGIPLGEPVASGVRSFDFAFTVHADGSVTP